MAAASAARPCFAPKARTTISQVESINWNSPSADDVRAFAVGEKLDSFSAMAISRAGSESTVRAALRSVSMSQRLTCREPNRRISLGSRGSSGDARGLSAGGSLSQTGRAGSNRRDAANLGSLSSSRRMTLCTMVGAATESLKALAGSEWRPSAAITLLRPSARIRDTKKGRPIAMGAAAENVSAASPPSGRTTLSVTPYGAIAWSLIQKIPRTGLKAGLTMLCNALVTGQLGQEWGGAPDYEHLSRWPRPPFLKQIQSIRTPFRLSHLRCNQRKARFPRLAKPSGRAVRPG